MSLIKDLESGKLRVTTFTSFKIGINNVQHIFNVSEYIDLNKTIIHPLDVSAFKLGDSVIIQGNAYNHDREIFSSYSSNMYISSYNHGIFWYLKGSQYCRVDTTDAMHTFGFVDGKPFYDGQIISPQGQATALTAQDKLIVSNGTNQIGSDANVSNNNLRISRIIIQTNGKTYSYYPVHDETANENRIYEALETATLLNEYYAGSTTGPQVKYGVSIDDIKSITGSKYRDLMAIVTEDSGSRVSENAHAPFIIRDSDNRQHTFAFYLGTSNETDKIPVNNIYNVDANSFSIYKPGDLIFGRRPKWNIWADCMPYSIWIRPKQDYTDSQRRDPTKLVYATYNLTHHWGKNGYVNLADWDNYCYDEAHVPGVEFLKKNANNEYVPIEYSSDKIEIPYHNGYSCYCDIPLPGLWDNVGSNGKNLAEYMFYYMLTKNNCIYMNHNIFPDSAVRMKAGNMINWGANQIEQYDADPIYVNQLIYGLCATLSHEFKTLLSSTLGLGSDPVTTNIIIGYRTAQTTDRQSQLSDQSHFLDTGTLLVALSSDSTQSTQDDFKEGIIYPDIRVTGNEPIRLFNEINSAVNSAKQHTYTIDATGDLSLIRASRILDQSETPLDTDLVYLTDFIPKGKIQIKGVFDQYEIDVDTIEDLAYDAGLTFDIPSSNDGNNMRLIFMNSNTCQIGEDESHDPIYSSKDLQIREHNDALNVNYNYPAFFFPIGFMDKDDYISWSASYTFNSGTYTKSHYKIIENHLYIPFVLTKEDLNSYDKFLNFVAPNIEGYRVQYTGDKVSNLRVYIQAIWCQEINGEKVIKKDKLTKVLPKIDLTNEEYPSGGNMPGSYNSNYEEVFGYKKYDFSGAVTDSRYSESDKHNINCRPFFWMIDIDNSDLLNICDGGNSNFPTDNLTIKFWVQNEQISSTVLTYGEFKYEAINDSWYAPIIGESLYLFVKDSPDNEWMNSAFPTDEDRERGLAHYNGPAITYDIIASHWFKGKKVNMFTLSNTTPQSLPVGGTFANPVVEEGSADANGWENAVPNGTFTKLWMTERYYSHVSYDITGLNSSDIRYKINTIETTKFTDASWSDPVEIYEDDSTNQHPFFELIVRNGHTVTANNLSNYVTFVEGDGYYGVSRNGTVLSIVMRMIPDNYGNYDSSYEYVNADDNSISSVSFETVKSDFGTVDEDNRTILNTEFLGINEDNSVSLLTDEQSNRYIANARIEDSSRYLFSVYNKYMFSINSSQSPLYEPNKWITFDQFKASNNRSAYNFMYHERTVFTMLGGECRKIFDIVQIGGDENVENYYPVTAKDMSKLNEMANVLDHSYGYWYKIGGFNDANKHQIRSTWNQIGRNEILAPYKINGLNVSVFDVVQYEDSMSIYPQGDSINNITGRNCELHISL